MDSNRLADIADVRAFFATADAASADGFEALRVALQRAYERRPAEVVEQWLPYALQQLETWPDDVRMVEWRVDFDEEAGVDHFLTRSHPLYALLRSFYVEEEKTGELTPYLRQLTSAPDFSEFTMLSAYWTKESLTPEALRELLAPSLGLEELAIGCFEFNDAHAAALAECPGLESLRALSVRSHAMSARGIRTLVASPHLRGLARLLIGESPGDLHWSRHDHDGSGERLLTPAQTLELSDSMPKLEMLLAPAGTRSMQEITKLPRVQTASLPSAEDRVRECLELYQRPNVSSAYPFDGESAVGFLVELKPQRLNDSSLILDDVFPTHTDAQEWTGIYGLGLEAGALDTCFDEDGALIAPLKMRCFGRVLDHPSARGGNNYRGQYVHQSIFAAAGLCLDEDERGHVWLRAPGHERCSDLVAFHRGLGDAERVFGGRNVEFACTPWHEVMGGVVEEYGTRSIVHWSETEHGFDLQGDLPKGHAQPVGVRGDVLPLRAALAPYQLELVSGDAGRLLLQRGK